MVVAVVLLVVFLGLFWRECWLDKKRFAQQQCKDHERLLKDFQRFVEANRLEGANSDKEHQD